jgi:hypothetical protein
MRIFSLFAITIFVTVTQTSVASAQGYSVVPIAAPPEATNVTPLDLNERLDVVGLANTAQGTRSFAWNPAGGFRWLPLTARWVDQAGVFYGSREVNGLSIVTRLVGESFVDLPQPPGDTLLNLLTVTDNGIVLAEGRNTRWALVGNQFYDVTALTGAVIFAVNDQGVLGGSKDGRAYLRSPDGWSFQPIADTSWVALLGPSGHFACPPIVFHLGMLATPSYFGAPDGRVWTVAGYAPPFYQFTAISADGALIGAHRSTLGGEPTPFIYRDGFETDLNTLIAASWRVSVPYAINHSGYIVATGAGGAALLVPATLTAPTGLVFQVSGNEVRLRWNAVAPGAEYILEAGSTSGAADFYAGSVGATTSLSATVPNGRYYVRVRARSANGLLTPPSNEAIIDVGSPGLPSAPTGLVYSVSGRTVAVHWQASRGATEYFVEAGTVPGGVNVYYGSVGAQLGISGTVAPGRYYVRVRALNAVGVSAPSVELVIDVP